MELGRVVLWAFLKSVFTGSSASLTAWFLLCWVLHFAEAELSLWLLFWLLASCYRAEAVWIEAFQVLFGVWFFLISEKLQLVVLVCLRADSTSSTWLRREDHEPPQPSCPALPALPSPAREKWSPSMSSSPVIQRMLGAPAIREISRAVNRGTTGTLSLCPWDMLGWGEPPWWGGNLWDVAKVYLAIVYCYSLHVAVLIDSKFFFHLLLVVLVPHRWKRVGYAYKGKQLFPESFF